MAYAGKTYCLPYIRNYSEAHAYFEDTAPVKARKNTHIWTADVRPLKGSGATHYRIRKGTAASGSTYYDLILYSTVMARYYAPVDGTETRYYTWHNSMTSKGFLWDVAGVEWVNCIKDTEGIERAVPIGMGKVEDVDGNHTFGCKLVLRDGKLCVAESDHEQLLKRVANNADRAVVAETKKRIEPLLDLMVLRMPTFEQDCEIDGRRGGAFGRKQSWNYSKNALHRLLDTSLPVEDAFTDEAVSEFYCFAQECYNVLASKRAMAMTKGDSGSWAWYRPKPAVDNPADLDVPITAADLVKSVTNGLLKDFRVARRSDRVPLPKFMPVEDFPKSNRGYY